MPYSRKAQKLLEKEDIKEGDKVSAKKGRKSYEGILMPRVMGDPDVLIIKLDNGYNIGVRADSVKKVPGKRALEKFPVGKIEQKKGLPEISILSTGGTIACRVDYVTGGTVPAFTPEEILYSMPELAEIVGIRSLKQLFQIFSENMKPENWKKMAEETARELNSGSEGVIIFHGTDTMGYSAAALSFMLRGLVKPVVLTGAQRSSDRGSSDTAFNVVCSAHAAKSDIAEVMTCLHGEMSDSYCLLNRGTKVRKMHASRRDTFRPINDLPIAKIWPDGRMEKIGRHRLRYTGEVVADTKFEEKVALLKVFPGTDPGIIDFLADKKYRGIVLEATGLGNAPNDWLPSIKNAIGNGMVVAYAPQTVYGRLSPFVYESLRRQNALGVVYCEDMLPETAYVKLGWVLGHTKDAEDAKKMMLTNYAGEISERSLSETFLY